MKTAILILNWNGARDTIQCLETLLPALGEKDFLFLIDNGSTDQSVPGIKEWFVACDQELTVTQAGDLTGKFIHTQKKYLVCNHANLGFGAGNNTVLSQLKKLDPEFEFAWLLNNDTVVASKTLSSLKNTLEGDVKLGAAGSLILNYPDNGTIQCSGVNHYRFFGVSKLINKNLPHKDLDKHAKIEFDYLNGASLLLRLSALQQTGYFDERFFLYSEEYDLELRLQNAGYGLGLNMESVVYHHLGGGTKHRKHLFYYYYNTSAILLSKKHFSIFFTLCAIINLSIITFVRTFPSFKNFSWGIKGIIKGLKNR